MEIAIIFFPFIGFIFYSLGGNFWGISGIKYLVILCLSITIVFVYYDFIYYILLLHVFFYKCNLIIDSSLLLLCWSFLFDNITSLMLIIVLTISFFVHLYSFDYMKYDSSFIRFFSYISLFTFFMLLLVSSENFFQLFIGWEGVGLCSYLLISFWYTRLNANKAALKALIINRLGDIGLLFGIALIYYYYGTLEFSIIFLLTPYFFKLTIFIFGFTINYIYICSIFLFFGVIGKSAQLGLHTWLPDAMEGPTPVSALIHAATMVTAGVFLLIRCSPFFEYSNDFLLIVMFFGSLTAFMASTIGLIEYDIKKIIAYSTCSQLGYMILSCSFSNYYIALYHLVTHAFFKALLFLGSGAVIHALNDEQDLRKMGGLRQILPFITSIFFIGSIALMGFPFMAGFYSKDLILENILGSYIFSKKFFNWLIGLATIMTSFYSTRLFYYIFWSSPNGYRLMYQQMHEISFFMGLILIFLSFFSIFSGYLLQEIFSIFNFWGGASIDILTEHSYILEIDFYYGFIKYYPLIYSFFGTIFFYFFYLSLIQIKVENNIVAYHDYYFQLLYIVISFGIIFFYYFFFNFYIFFIFEESIIIIMILLFTYFYYFLDSNKRNDKPFYFYQHRKMKITYQYFQKIYNFFLLKWFFDFLQNKYLGKSFLNLGTQIYIYVDKGFLEYFGPRGLFSIVLSFSITIIYIHNLNFKFLLFIIYLYYLFYLIFFTFDVFLILYIFNNSKYISFDLHYELWNYINSDVFSYYMKRNGMSYQVDTVTLSQAPQPQVCRMKIRRI